MKKRKNKITKFFKSLNGFSVFFGMLSNFGVIIFSILILNSVYRLINIETEISTINIVIVYFLSSVGIYFLIGYIKSFKIGYLIGLVLGLTHLLKAIFL